MDAEADLLVRLRRFAAADRRSRLPTDPPTLSFVADERERISGLCCPWTALIAVVEGSKELWQGERSLTCETGTAVALPRGWSGDVVNIPHGRSGFYRAVVLIFSEERLAELAAEVSDAPQRGGGLERHRLPLDAALGGALLAALEGLASADPANGGAQAQVDRVARLLLARGVFDGTAAGAVASRLRAMVRARPDEALSLVEAAGRLKLSPATVKRRLAAEGHSFSGLVTAERMRLAQSLIAQGYGRLTDVAGACGYRSLSKFSRRYRAVTGAAPAAVSTGK